MEERIEEITSSLIESASKARSLFGSFSTAQLNWKPSESVWSVGQCIEHIIKTNEEFYPEFEKLASGKRKNSFWENYSPLTAWGGRFLINTVSIDSKKAKAPSKRIVPPSVIDADIISRFERHLSDMKEKIECCSAADRKKTVVTSPFLVVFTYSLDDAYTVLIEHTKRHIRQAERVVKTEGFPSAETAQAAFL